MLAVARRWYRIIIAVVIGVAVLLVARRLLGARQPQSPAAPAPAPTPPTPRAAPVDDGPPPASLVGPPEDDSIDGTPEDDGPEGTPDATATEAPAVEAGAAASAAWVPSTDGACPADHPVKAKEASGIFHVEGGLSYERTRADRCYLSPEAAEADGYRPAKR